MPSDLDLLTPASLVPTTENLEIAQIVKLDIDPELKETLIRLYLFINRMLLSIAEKDTANYSPTEEFVTGGTMPYADNFQENERSRSIYRFVYEADVLAAGLTSIPLGFTVGSTWRFIKIYGAATNQTTGNHYPLPFASAGGAANIELRLTNTTIEITNNSGQTFLGLIVVVEYVKVLPA